MLNLLEYKISFSTLIYLITEPLFRQIYAWLVNLEDKIDKTNEFSLEENTSVRSLYKDYFLSI